MRNRREFQIRLFLVIATCFVLSILGACSGDDENLAGPCYHEYKSVILEIEDARASGSNEQITTFRISSVTLNGHNYDLANLVGGQSFGIVLQSGELICTVPCGFGNEDGTYDLSITGDGLQPQVVSTDAHYDRVWGNCPSFSEGATKITAILEEL